jgi:hypothetical protein
VDIHLYLKIELFAYLICHLIDDLHIIACVCFYSYVKHTLFWIDYLYGDVRLPNLLYSCLCAAECCRDYWLPDKIEDGTGKAVAMLHGCRLIVDAYLDSMFTWM